MGCPAKLYSGPTLIAALSEGAASALVLHIAGYEFTNLAAFIPVIAYYNLTGKDEIADVRGMAERAQNAHRRLSPSDRP